MTIGRVIVQLRVTLRLITMMTIFINRRYMPENTQSVTRYTVIA